MGIVRTAIVATCLVVSLGSYADNMSLRLRKELLFDNKHFAADFQSKNNRKSDYISIEIKIDKDVADIEFLTEKGFEESFRVGSTLYGRVKRNLCAELAGQKGVLRIDIPRIVKPSLDVLKPSTGVDLVHTFEDVEFPWGIKGKGVTVAVIDAGVDPTHPAFRNPETGESRIIRYVRTFDATESENGMFTVECYETPEEIESASIDAASGGHGTHTGGIAVGSECGNGYGGVATESDIIFVTTGDNITTEELVYGLDYVARYAESTGNPTVVNLSLGSLFGAHDGISELTEVVQKATDAGVIVCFAAGNDGHRKYTRLFEPDDFVDGEAKTAYVSQRGTTALDFYSEAWSSDLTPFDVKFTVIDTTTGEEIYSTEYVDSEKLLDADDIVFLMTPNTSDNNQLFPELGNYFNGYLLVSASEEALNGKFILETLSMCYTVSGPYILGVGIKPRKQSQSILMLSECDLDGTAVADGSYISGNADNSISDHCVDKNVISVGSWNSRDSWPLVVGGHGSNSANYYGKVGEITRFSSYGGKFPSDGTVYPDVVAPGAAVVSSLNSEVSNNPYITASIKRENGKNYRWGGMSGTSMAAPAVTGIIALWLEAAPWLDTEDVREVLKATSYIDDYIESQTSKFRYGKVDAFEGLKYVLESKTGIMTISDCDISHVVRNNGDCIELLMPNTTGKSNWTLLQADGKIISYGEFYDNNVNIPLSGSGVRLLRISSKSESFTVKIL